MVSKHDRPCACFTPTLHTCNKPINALHFLRCPPEGALFDHISCCNAADHQGAGADVPPKERLPILCGNEGPLLWLVCPGGQVRITHMHACSTHAHTHTHLCINEMHTHSDRQTQTPTYAIPSVKHSGVFVQCFMADTFSTPLCLYSISCCP